MSGRRSTPPRLAAAAAAVLALALLAASCADDLSAPGPRSDIGILEGRVTEAGVPIAADIELSYLQDADLRISATAHADSTGWYRIAVPIGGYRVRVEPDGSYHNWLAASDTVVVGRVVRRFDLRRGRLRVDVRLPDDLDLSSVSFELGSRGMGTSWSGYPDGGSVATEMRGLPPGDYTIRLDLGGATPRLYLPDPTRVDTLHVNGEAETSVTCDLRPYDATLAGRITSSPVFDGRTAQVTLYGPQQTAVARARPDREGRYRLHVFTPVTGRVLIETDEVERWLGGASFADATGFIVQPGTHLENLDLAGGGLRVLFEAPEVATTPAGVVEVQTGDGRTFRSNDHFANPTVFELLPPGPARLRVLGACANDPWQPQWFDGAADSTDATWLDIALGTLGEATVNLARGGVIRGVYTHTSADPPWRVYLAVHDLEGQPLCPGTIVTGGTQFELRGLPDGTYLLGLYLNSWPWWYPGTWVREEATPVTVTGAATVSGLSWPLPFPYNKERP